MPIPPDALAVISTGAKWLAGAAPATVAVWRLLSHDRTLLYALWPKLAKKVDARKRQEIIITESQKVYSAELKALGKQSVQLTEKLLKAAPAKRHLIERDLEYVQARKREAETKFAALKDIAADTTKRNDTGRALLAKPISGHWMDQFNELVRRRNEEWRGLLLKDALVREAQAPGTISPRVLWLIGILEPEKFELLAGLLNVASRIAEVPIIPCENIQFHRTIVPGLEDKNLTLSMTAIALSDTGLLQDSSVVWGIDKGETVRGSYDGKEVEITALGLDGRVEGIIFTSPGNTVASLYTAIPNTIGRELFDRWVKSCRPAQYSIKWIADRDIAAI